MNNYKILIVDDVIDNIQVVMNILKEDSYDFSYAKTGHEALELVKNSSFDLILLDIMMPGIDGYEVCKELKNDPRYTEIPVIFLTAKTDVDSLSKGFEVGAIDYITKPFHANELLARVKTHLDLYRAKKILLRNNLSLKNKLELEKERIATELEESQREMICVLGELVEAVSDETGRHIHRVAELSRLFTHFHSSLSPEDEDIIYHASPMHDIGKMSIPKEILHKQGSLTEEEFEIMKTHTSHGRSYLRYTNRKLLRAANIIAHEHHEKWNGKGYPQELSGTDIHIYARIVSIADVFDALTHKRVYKDSWTIEKAVEYIIERKGTQFDPYLVEIFEQNLDEFKAVIVSELECT